MLELKNVTKRVGEETHLEDISMRLEPGSINVLLGPTLSGKTSLMRIMAGLDKPTEGAVFADGEDVTSLPVQKRNVAMVYQQFINYPALSVYENIASPMRIAGRPKDEIDATVRKNAELLRLTPFLDRLPLNLSGGQQQRTALARALAKDARLVLLDEPLANLDYKLREELRAELPKIFAASGAIFVYATAEPEEALLLGGNTATLKEGRVTQFGPTVEIYRTPNTLGTAATFSDPPLNTVAVEKAGDVFKAPGAGKTIEAVGPAASLPDARYTLGIRPHHLTLEPQTNDAISLTGTVSITEITGSESFIHMSVLGHDWTMLTHGVHDRPPGESVTFHFAPRHLLIFDADGNAVSMQPAAQAA